MAKQPAPGQTKTRLCPPLTAPEAADLYTCFLLDAIALARCAAARLPGVSPGLAYAPPAAAGYFARLTPDLLLVPQIGAGLNRRLHHVLTTGLSRGYGQVVAVNSDSPSLPVDYLVDAHRCLADPAVDVVLGPCEDGGYYLIGVKRPPGRLVRDVEMSTPRVLEDTLAIAEMEGLRVHLLPPWYDVDGQEELERLRAELATTPQSAPHTRRFLWERAT